MLSGSEIEVHESFQINSQKKERLVTYPDALIIVVALLQVAKLKALLNKAGKPSGFALLDGNGRLPQNLLVAGYDKYSLYDLVGSLFTWPPLLPAEEARVQEEVEAGITQSLYVTRLIRKPALSFVPRLRTATVTQRFPFMEKQEKPLKTGNILVRSTIMAVITRLTEGARCHGLSSTSLGSQTHITTTAFAAAGNKIQKQTKRSSVDSQCNTLNNC